ncbi:hypothetical protein VDGD_20886 [Verticillium dahliae]|nr:hypothetical protein VDGD_20886 [Verticillium dahliae]
MGFAVAGDPDADITPFSALILIGVVLREGLDNKEHIKLSSH